MRIFDNPNGTEIEEYEKQKKISVWWICLYPRVGRYWSKGWLHLKALRKDV